MQPGELAVGLARELRNPLHIIRGAAEILASLTQTRGGRAYARQGCQEIVEEVDRIDRLLADLLHYAAPVEPDHGATSELSALLHSVRGPIEEDARCSILVRGAPSGECQLRVAMASEHTRALLYYLLRYAALAASERGLVSVSMGCREGAVYLDISHDGRLVDNAQLPELLQPFAVPSGASGLDLAIAHRLVSLYDGRLTLRAGATQVLRLQSPAVPTPRTLTLRYTPKR